MAARYLMRHKSETVYIFPSEILMSFFFMYKLHDHA